MTASSREAEKSTADLDDSHPFIWSRWGNLGAEAFIPGCIGLNATCSGHQPTAADSQSLLGFLPPFSTAEQSTTEPVAVSAISNNKKQSGGIATTETEALLGNEPVGSKPNNQKTSGVAEPEALVGNVPVGSKPNNKKQSGVAEPEALVGNKPVGSKPNTKKQSGIAKPNESVGSKPNNKKQSDVAKPEELLGKTPVGSKPNNKKQSGDVADSAIEAVAEAGTAAAPAKSNSKK